MEGSPGEVELGRLATPEEDCEEDEPGEEEEVVVKGDMKGEDAEEVEEEQDVKVEEKVSLLERRGSPLLSSTGTSMNTQGDSLTQNTELSKHLQLYCLRTYVRTRHDVSNCKAI